MEDFKSSSSAFGMGYPEQRKPSFAWFRINSQFGANGATLQAPALLDFQQAFHGSA